MSALGQLFGSAELPVLARSETVAESVFFDLSRPEQDPFGGRSGAQSQVVKDVGDVPTAVDNTDNLDDAGTLPVEDKIPAVRNQS